MFCGNSKSIVHIFNKLENYESIMTKKYRISTCKCLLEKLEAHGPNVIFIFPILKIYYPFFTKCKFTKYKIS
jgi:hypothetical protein